MGTTNPSLAAEDTVIYLHIHKTAGTTLQQIIDRQYDPAQIWTFGDRHRFDDFRELGETQKAGISLLRGHMIFGLHEFMPGASTYFTVLREPVERVVSFLYHIRRRPFEGVRCDHLSLIELLESRQISTMDNGQTRMLAGGEQYEYPFGECTDELLQVAKRNLRESFSVVGLFEHFDETLLLLQRTFGWQNLYYVRENVSPGRPSSDELPVATVDLIAEHNRLDLQLYEYARRLFEEQVQGQGPQFPLDVRRYQRANRRRTPLTKAHREIRKHSVRMWLRERVRGIGA